MEKKGHFNVADVRTMKGYCIPSSGMWCHAIW